MTTNKFIKAVENLGYEVEKDEECITVKYKNTILAYVFINELCRMSSCFSEMDCIEKGVMLFILMFQYAVTQIEDREEKKKYYLRHKWVKTIGSDSKTFLNYHEEEDKFYLYTADQTSFVKTEFTEKEIKEIKEKFDTDLKDFELAEVEE